LRAKGQVTLPDEIRKAARLDEGDLLEADAQEAAGRGQTFDSGETFLEALRAQVKPSERRRKH
jgi:bifunctional DNA-binding transcriptional regulator/antitoxin component of YhaV-PrlF toxin-antitoxin module